MGIRTRVVKWRGSLLASKLEGAREIAMTTAKLEGIVFSVDVWCSILVIFFGIKIFLQNFDCFFINFVIFGDSEGFQSYQHHSPHQFLHHIH